mgnify:CR=1 FL=1
MSAFQSDSGFSIDFGGGVSPDMRRRIKWMIPVVGVVLLLAILTFLRSVYTDLLWFEGVGFRSVFVKILVTRIALFLVGFAIVGVPLGLSVYFANRASQGPEDVQMSEAARGFITQLIRWGMIVAIVVLSAILGTIVASKWELFLRFADAASFGVMDPVYGKDLSFYVFSLPLYGFFQGWLLSVAIVILIATVVTYFINFSLRGIGFLITPGLRVQVSIIVGVIMFLVGFGHWLDRWGLLLSDQGVVFGATYTDIYSRKPALLILTFVAGASGVLVLVNAYMKGIRLAIGGLVLWVALSIVLGTLWPNAMERFTVTPNQFFKENRYIANNIELTRLGFGLNEIVSEPYSIEPTVTSEMVRDNLQTVNNIRLWDPDPLSRVYQFEQVIRPYYDFEDADVDQYVVGDRYRQVMLAAREVSHSKLEVEAQTWINTKLRYTHGFGVAMSPVAEVTTKGSPYFFAKDIPSDGVIEVQNDPPTGEPVERIMNPRIYYGERTDEYVIVNTNTEELDYQAEGGELRSNNYDGKGGVPISSLVRRLAYAWQFGDLNILITGEINSGSRLQYRREIQDRISAISPFLRLDEDPYVVAADGRLFWVQDAYTVSAHLPYSAPIPSGEENGFNYIRNSVKITVDAFDGSVNFYVWDREDPLIRTYGRIFGNMFQSRDQMPEALQSHVRYPRDLFGFQAAKYLKYHMLDPQAFYNQEDIWNIPNEKFGQGGDLQPVDPYYVILKLPGEQHEEFVLLLPYTRNEPNPILAGWLAARSDNPNYGELVAFSFPKDRQVDGPEQVEARIDIDQSISEWFTLRCQEGSFCIRGNLLIIPLGGSLLYVEPVYLQAEGVDFPELSRVILASGDTVVMENSLEEALQKLTGYSKDDKKDYDDGDIPKLVGDSYPIDTPGEHSFQEISETIEKLKRNLFELEEALKGLIVPEGGQ